MKKERKEIIRKEYKDIYIAIDGEEFTSEEECKKYEQTAEAVINAAFEKTKFGNPVHNVGDQFYSWGCEEDLFCVHITDEHDLHDVNMWMMAHDVSPCGYLWCRGDRGKVQFDTDEIGTIQVLSVVCDCDYYAYGSFEQMQEYLHREADKVINALIEPKKDKEEE